MMTFPYVERLSQAYSRKGLTVWGISQDPLDDSLAFARDYGATFPILLDTTWDVSDAYGLDTVPTLFLLDDAGKIIFTSVSFFKDELNQIARLVAQRLGLETIIVAPPDDGEPAFKPG
jgi:peroxiredoxin